mgnify:CR=1 FL=1
MKERMNFGKFLIRLCTPLAHLIFPFKTLGREHIPPASDTDRIVLICNHISEIDPVFLEMGQRRHIYFMAKEELFHSRFNNWFFGKQLGAFPVRRGKGGRSTRPGMWWNRDESWAYSRKEPVQRTGSWGALNLAPLLSYPRLGRTFCPFALSQKISICGLSIERRLCSAP